MCYGLIRFLAAYGSIQTVLAWFNKTKILSMCCVEASQKSLKCLHNVHVHGIVCGDENEQCQGLVLPSKAPRNKIITILKLSCYFIYGFQRYVNCLVDYDNAKPKIPQYRTLVRTHILPVTLPSASFSGQQ